MKHFKITLLLMFVLLSVVVNAATDTLIANASGCNAGTNFIGTNSTRGQGFRWNATIGTLKNVEILAGNNSLSAGAVIRLRIYNGLDSLAGSVAFEQNYSNIQTLPSSSTCGTMQWLNFSVNTALTINNNYSIEFKAMSGTGGMFHGQLAPTDNYCVGACPNGKLMDDYAFYTGDSSFAVWDGIAGNLQLTAQNTYNSTAITSFNATVNGTFYTTTNGTIVTNIPLNTGLVNITQINSTYFFSNSSVNFDTSYNYVANLTPYTQIYVISLLSGVRIANFSINYTNSSGSFSTSTQASLIQLPIYDEDWNLTAYYINHNGQNFAIQNATLNGSPFVRNYTFYVFTTNSFNFTFRDEITGAILYSLPAYGTDNITVDLLGSLISYTYEANGTLYVDLLTPQAYTIRYQKPNFGRLRSYLITLTNETTNNLDLYLLNESISSDLTVTVYDQDTLNTIAGAVVYLQRFNVTCNCYVTVAMGETDVEGNTYFDVQQSAELYKFIVDYPWNTLRFTSDPLYIEVTQLNLYISLTGELLGGFFNSTGITGQIYYTNTTGGEFNIVYVDSTASADQYCLTVKTWNQYDKEIVNISCSTSPSGSFSLGGLTNPGTTYYGVFTAYIDGQNITVKTVWEEIPSTSLGATQFGIFLSLGLFLVLVFLSQLHIMGLILGAFSLFISKAIGILPVSWGLCTVIFIASLIIALLLDKR